PHPSINPGCKGAEAMPKPHCTPDLPPAYSYIRFSYKRQEQGDSIRRQESGAKEWAQRNKDKVRALDTSLKQDRGAAACRGKNHNRGQSRNNPDLNGLEAFLHDVENGRVPKGSYLVVESLDRLTREDVQPALRLILNMTGHGIRIVQLQPVEMIYDDKS